MFTVNKSNIGLWKNLLIQKRIWIGLMLLFALLSVLPLFFKYIENRNGFVLKDMVLQAIPAYEVSTTIFIIIWGATFFMVYRVIQSPILLPILLWSYIFVLITRIISLYLIPLDPPLNLIPLQDPLTKLFYGNRNVIKDLFYSGHTATMFIFYLCHTKKKDKILSLIFTIVVALLLLLQHIHYTVDILFAPFFAVFSYKLAKSVCKKIKYASC